MARLREIVSWTSKVDHPFLPTGIAPTTAHQMLAKADADFDVI